MRLTILHPEMCVSMVSFIAGYEKSCFRFGVRTDNSHLCSFVNKIYNQLSCSLSFYLNWYGECIINYYDFLLGLYVYATFVQYNNARKGIKTYVKQSSGRTCLSIEFNSEDFTHKIGGLYEICTGSPRKTPKKPLKKSKKMEGS